MRRVGGGLEQAAADAVVQALGSAAGDVLVFLPGVGEISRVGALLAQEGERGPKGALIVPLHGNLSPQQQDKAIR